MASKKPSTAIVVGQRLRKYLGTFLALGFGVAWWAFVPPSPVAAAVPVTPPIVASIEIPKPPKLEVVAVVAMPLIVARPVKPIRRPRINRPRIVVPQVALVDLPPVVEMPVIEPLPVIEMPVIEPVIEPPPVTKKPPRIRIPDITTRSS